MYEEYYGFNEKPFSLTPDPKYLYKSESHASAYELLHYAVRRREGFAVVTGDIGTGKTTLCRALLEEIDRNTFTALVLNPFLTEEDLLKLILQDFGVVSRDDVKRGRLGKVSKQELIETIYDFLLSLLPLKASAVLIIDEAQNLPMPVLEQIRILSNLETDKEKLLQIVLVGQLNLQPLLKAPQMRQLDQRVSIRYQLQPLSRDEVAAYIAHRLTVAGGSQSISFQPKAFDLVHRLTGGIPRLVNLLCDRTLLGSYAARTNRVTPEMVEQAAENLELPGGQPSRFGWLRRRASVVVTAVGATASLAVVGGVVVPDLRAAATKAAVTPVPSPAPAIAKQVPPQPVVKPVEVTQPVRAQATLSLPAPPASAGIAQPRRHAVLVSSFPLASLARVGSIANVKLDEVVAQLQGLGYTPRLRDVDLGENGEWRGVIVGEFATLEDAQAEADRLHQTLEFSDAKATRY